jgi:pimeloyl-ACP methyl ester carboxylesterase
VDALFRGAYAPLKGVKLVRADGSRHFVMFDQPERFLSETAAFLGE